MAVATSGKPRPSGPLSPGTTGTPAACMRARALVLPPMARIAEGGGPMKVAPAAATASAKSAFSERKPYPGCTPSAPLFRMASTSLSITR